MKAINTMSLTFDSLSQNESFARSAAAGFFTQLNPTVEELCDIRTAVSEAVTNSIVHGYRNAPGRIYGENGRKNFFPSNFLFGSFHQLLRFFTIL